MKVDELKLAVISDVHLNHRNNDTAFIVNNLYTAFPDTAETWELDLICIAGDLFDRLMNYPDESLNIIERFLLHLMRICATHGICLRVLEGTKSHDWKQSSIFERLAEAAKFKNLDLKYHVEPTVEHIEKLGVDVLFVPDEWDEDTSRTLAHVKELMRLRGLTKVQFAFMHGQFEYQLPEVVKAPKHDSEAYLQIVEFLIFIGHVHTFSNYKRIYAQGSFDRLIQGEEGPKGHLRARVRSADDYTVTFVENKNARIFKTITCTSLTLEETLEEVRKQVVGIPDRSFVRLEVDKQNPILNEMGALLGIRPLITWSKKIREEKDQIVRVEDSFKEEKFVPVTITKDNVCTLLMNRLKSRNYSPEFLESAEVTIMDLR